MTYKIADFIKQVGETLDFSIDWTGALVGSQTISSATWTISPVGLTQVSASVVGKITTIRVSGGTAGVTYTADCAATLSDGQIYTGALAIAVQ